MISTHTYTHNKSEWTRWYSRLHASGHGRGARRNWHPHSDTGMGRSITMHTALFSFLDGVALVLLRRVERHLRSDASYFKEVPINNAISHARIAIEAVVMKTEKDAG